MTRDACHPTILVRPSNDADVLLMLAIYRHHVCHGVGDTGIYEPAPFDAEDLKQRRKSMRRLRLPKAADEVASHPKASCTPAKAVLSCI